MSDPERSSYPEYIEGLRCAIAAALDYALAVLRREEQAKLPIPLPLLTQAGLAARAGIGLDVVLRRYLTGYTLLNGFLIEAAEQERLDTTELQPLLRANGGLFDRLLEAVTDEYTRGLCDRHSSSQQRRAEQIDRLLDGELIDTSQFPYDFDACHLALIASGPGAGELIRQFADALDRRLLQVPHGDTTIWGWLGGHLPLDPHSVQRLAASALRPGAHLALGEPGEGLEGWRFSHRQARAVGTLGLRTSSSVVRYADVAVTASIARDELLVTSLRRLYLEPLSEERDGGRPLRRTLRAYFDAERNVSSTAAALGVSRQTVLNRIRTAERRFGRSLGNCAVELDLALRLDDLGGSWHSSPALPLP